MSTKSFTTGLLVHRITTDAALGAVGCSLAAAAATFGVYMTIHGPSASFGTSKDFSVFAQLAPRRIRHEDLDMTPTASITPRTAAPLPPQDPETSIVSGIALSSATEGRAEIILDGEMRSVRVGDMIPGVGEVLAIRTGRDPSVRTAAGLIVAAR